MRDTELSSESPIHPLRGWALHTGRTGGLPGRRWNVLLILLSVAAAILIGRGAVTQNDTLFPLADFAHGTAPMPFQARYAMAPVLRWAGQSAAMDRLAHALRNSCRGPEELAIQLTDALCLVLCLPVAMALRQRFVPAVSLPWLTPALLLWVVAITFTVRYEQRLYMPYDFVSLLLFSLGVMACVDRRGWLFLLLMIAGTYNRETTVFLVPVWVVCTWGRRERAVSVGAAVAGVVIWVLVRHQIHGWVGNASSGLMVDWRRNLTLLLPHHLAQVFSAGGYLALPMLVWRGLVRDRRLRVLWWGLLPFVLSDLAFGLWNETRIFGELSVVLAVTAAVQFEQYLISQYGREAIIAATRVSLAVETHSGEGPHAVR